MLGLDANRVVDHKGTLGMVEGMDGKRGLASFGNPGFGGGVNGF